MVQLSDLQEYIDGLLEVSRFQDYAPNGLQVEGRGQVGRLVSGVSASLALIEAAIAAKADAILVHHGYFWKGEAAPIVGVKARRLRLLLGREVSLLAYHLPLDAHPLLGNNAQLARLLQCPVEGRFGPGEIAMFGTLPEPLAAAELGRRIELALGRAPLHIAGGERPIRRLGWCSGAAEGYIEQAAGLGLDAYISGEIAEPTVHLARELGIHYFAAGHHATERYGVQALGEHLAARFDISHEFMEIANPV